MSRLVRWQSEAAPLSKRKRFGSGSCCPSNEARRPHGNLCRAETHQAPASAPSSDRSRRVPLRVCKHHKEMEDDFQDQFRTIHHEKLPIIPDPDTTYVNNATRLLEKRRELAEVEGDLVNQREEFHVKLRVLKQRKEDLLEKEEELKLSILKFDKFLKENDAKRLRAKSKQMSENDLQKQKEKEIIKLEKELGSLVTQRGKLKKKAEIHAVYPSFLENVIKIGDEFQDIRMVTSRFEALMHTYDLLFRRYQENQETIKIIKSDLNNFIKTKNNENMKYQNMIAGLKIRLEAAKTKTVKWESIWVHIQNTAARKTLTLGMVKMAIFNLYAHIKEAELDLNIAIEDTNEQLSVVQDYIMQLREIIHDFKKMES